MKLWVQIKSEIVGSDYKKLKYSFVLMGLNIQFGKDYQDIVHKSLEEKV